MRTKVLWVGLITLVVTSATAFSVISARRLGPQQPPQGALADGLATRVVTLMESDFADRTDPTGGRVSCAARPFGVRPEGLTRAAQATTIYAWVYCRAGARTLFTPLALRLGGPPSVRMPARGSDHERSIRRIFPADVRDALRRTDTGSLRSSLPAHR